MHMKVNVAEEVISFTFKGEENDLSRLVGKRIEPPVYHPDSNMFFLKFNDGAKPITSHKDSKGRLYLSKGWGHNSIEDPKVPLFPMRKTLCTHKIDDKGIWFAWPNGRPYTPSTRVARLKKPVQQEMKLPEVKKPVPVMETSLEVMLRGVRTYYQNVPAWNMPRKHYEYMDMKLSDVLKEIE